MMLLQRPGFNDYFKNRLFSTLNVSKEAFFLYFTFCDFQVSTMLCRDLDSRIIPREVEAVNEWLESEKSLHVMRDHPNHDFEMVGCCWGMKLPKKDREMVAAAFHNGATDQSLWAYKDKYLPDQNFLRRYVNKKYPEGASKVPSSLAKNGALLSALFYLY